MEKTTRRDFLKGAAGLAGIVLTGCASLTSQDPYKTAEEYAYSSSLKLLEEDINNFQKENLSGKRIYHDKSLEIDNFLIQGWPENGKGRLINVHDAGEINAGFFVSKDGKIKESEWGFFYNPDKEKEEIILYQRDYLICYTNKSCQWEKSVLSETNPAPKSKGLVKASEIQRYLVLAAKLREKFK